ncbi:hypothetical protein ACQPVP_00370 [Clostridium nigeriense]|uniref:hypothetical protein n=1 Tax=Clostridium nigeriense TaxID=1805470 RepID=UPI003D3591D7
MENLKKIEIDFNSLNQLVLDKDEEFLLVVRSNGVNFEFLVKRKVTSENLIVFGSGAYNINKLRPPIFQRYSWINEFDENIIYYNDPTLYLSDITLGWGYGTEKIHYLEIIYKIIDKLINIIKIQRKKTIFYGSSGGGFMSIILSTFLKGSTAIVNNPQVDITKYHIGPIRKLFSQIYADRDINDIFKIKRERLNVIDMFKKENYIPRIVYYQNIACDFDIENQFYVFINELRSLDEKNFYTPIDIKLYFNREENHNPLSKNQTINIIKRQIEINNNFENIIEIKNINWKEFSKREGYSLFRYENKIPIHLLGDQYKIFCNNKQIQVLPVKKIDKAGFGEVYANNHLYISIDHKDIKNNEEFDIKDIQDYFFRNKFVIYY